uniref:Uncharacterized protein n=1 Tax=Anguilla anguilla TaxID=7936 RepID=A0A0E9V7H5_ANGAN
MVHVFKHQIECTWANRSVHE